VRYSCGMREDHEPLRFEGLRLRKAVVLRLRAVASRLTAVPVSRKAGCFWLKAGLISLLGSLVCASGWGQMREPTASGGGGIQSIGITGSFSPDSSHMLIGLSQQRRTWTAGFEYTHLLYAGDAFRFDYEGSVMPFWQESDPVLLGTTFTLNGQTFVTQQTPYRVVTVNRGPVGVAEDNGVTVPIYALWGRQDTLGGSLAPLGARLSAFPRSRIQPSLSVDTGFVVATRDIPIDLSDQFNYMFSFGAGVRLYTSQLTSVRLDYVYRHISNAHQGFENPGVDQGVVRLTVSKHW
jgi:hypothetical protein